VSRDTQLSVVIPHLNEPGDLRRCLTALESQRTDGVQFEIIVVDNGSAALPSEVCADFPDVRLELERTPGPGPARNKGASAAQAPLLAFIDCDCFAAPGWVRAIVDHMTEHPTIDFIGGDIRIEPASPGRLTAVEAYEDVFSYRAQLYVERYGFAATGNMAVRKSVFRAVGPFGGIGTMEDTEWGKRATALGYKIAYLAEARVTTASCRSFRELAVRWDRHTAHEYREVEHHVFGIFRWLVSGALMAASPPLEIVRILRSDRVTGLRMAAAAFACLTRVRLYRARRMFQLALRDTTRDTVGRWNRGNS